MVMTKTALFEVMEAFCDNGWLRSTRHCESVALKRFE